MRKKFLSGFALVGASLGLIITSGIFKGNLQGEEPFEDPIQYETPIAEVYKEPLQAAEEPTESNVKKVIIHYYRDDHKNNTRQIYTWYGNAVKYSDLVYDTPGVDDGYAHIELDLTGEDIAYAGKSYINFIVKYAGTWDGQSQDSVLDYEEFQPDENGVVEVWTMPAAKGLIEIYATKGETQFAKVTKAYFTNWKTIHAVADEKPSVYRLYAFDKTYLIANELKQARLKNARLIKTAVPSGKEFNITFNYTAHINVQYVIETEYESHQKVQSIIVTNEKLYSNANFTTYYGSYTGDDLGCTWTKDKTTFKVWAPTAGAVVLNVYNKGTPKNVLKSGSNLRKQYVMTMQPQGVWEKTLLTPDGSDSLEGKYYTYTVFNSEGENEVCDPYAKACGVNGIRGMILDFSKTNPTNWDNVPTKWDGVNGYDIKTPQELSIYEVHIRDLTDDETWTGNARNGSYQAFYEKGTRYTKGSTTVKTGFDHIEEMKVNTVQIMPTFDHDNGELQYYYKRDAQGQKTDETVVVPANYSGEYKDELELDYNWGYNPLNYNCLEGSYSSDPEDGAARVREFKELVYAYATNANKTRITMDVVYNHVSSVSKSNFSKLMPLYYFRFNEAEDVYWNGSGCSNEVKSEAKMMRKFIVDSLCWWAKEYKVKGFRFDLMELIDITTLNEARKALYKIDPDIYLYGEGWKAADSGIQGTGASTTVVYTQAKAGNSMVHLGAFNDGGRNALKGGNDGGNIGYSRFEWRGSEAPTAGSGYKDYALSVGGWSAAGAEMWVHAWGGGKADKDYKLNDITKLRIYDGYTDFVLVRMAPGSTSINWESNWGKSNDAKVQSNGTFTFKDWGTIRTPGATGFFSRNSATGNTPVEVGKMATGYNVNTSVTQDPRQTVVYASCHDNFTLYDQFSWVLATNPNATNPSSAASTSNIMKAIAASERAVATSNGVAFILGGDELGRTKVEYEPEKSRLDEDYVEMFGTKISHNSYKSSPRTNSFKWDRKISVQGYNGTSTNNFWSQIADAFAKRKEMAATGFGAYSNSTSDPGCNYYNTSAGGTSVSWYVGGYCMTLTRYNLNIVKA